MSKKLINDSPPNNQNIISLISKSIIDYKNKKPRDVATRLKSMHDNGLLDKKNKKYDSAFVLLKRYLNSIEWIKTTKDYRDNPLFYKSHMPINQIEEVRQACDEIYTLLNAISPGANDNTRDSIFNADKRLALNDNVLNDETLDITLNFPETPTDEPINSEVDSFISCRQLYELLPQIRFLIIDTRSMNDFDRSHIRTERCVNIPSSKITRGILVKKLESFLREHRNSYQAELFKKRHRRYLDSLILLDWNTNRKTEESHLLLMKELLTNWDYGNIPPDIFFLDGGYIEWLNVYPQTVTDPHIPLPNDEENDAMDEILEEVTYPSWARSEELSPKAGKKLNHDNVTIRGNYTNSKQSNYTTNNSIINSNGSKKPFDYIDENSGDLTSLSQEVQNIDLQTNKISSNNSPISKPPIDRSNKPSSNPQSLMILDLLRQLSDVADYQEKIERQLSKIDNQIFKKSYDDEYDSEDLDTLKSQHKAVALTLEEIIANKMTLKSQWESIKLPKILMNNVDAREAEKLELKLGHHENQIANIQMERKIQHRKKQQYDEEQRMHRTPNDNNNRIYKEPLKNEGSTTNTGLKRSLSSPNLAQLEDRKTPQIDRSSKPLNIRKYVRETNNNLQISCRNPEKEMDPVYRNTHPGITGLKNLGNSCYMNSIIQCLSNTAYLAKYFIENAYEDDLNTNSDNETRGQIAVEFASVIKALWRGQYKSIAPHHLKKTIGHYKLQFDSYEQQDSHEFLTFLLDWMHNDLRKDDIKLRRDGPLSAADKEWEKAMEGQISTVSQLFYGQLRSSICCMTCSSRSITYETFNSLSISLMESYRCTLDDCLKNFLSGQKISGWACPNCKKPRDATKKFDFVKLAPIMVIHLNRFAGTDVGLEKKNTQVVFPLNDLDLRPYLVIDSDSSNTLHNNSRHYNYNLYAMSNHYGSMGGGHYTALCKNSTLNKWYKYDDQTVTEVAESYVKTQCASAYLLFYSS
ncbi:hypothetical protein PV326_003335, partial [Microctonus aethiopoides]